VGGFHALRQPVCAAAVTTGPQTTATDVALLPPTMGDVRGRTTLSGSGLYATSSAQPGVSDARGYTAFPAPAGNVH
jgi:hypothetical protein